jgi:hypothetical protein
MANAKAIDGVTEMVSTDAVFSREGRYLRTLIKRIVLTFKEMLRGRSFKRVK